MNDCMIRRSPSPDPLFPQSRIMRCAFTGYRPQKMPFGFDESSPLCADFKHRLFETIEMLVFQGYTHFLSGGALGMDMFAAEAVLALRRQYPHIVLELVIPFDAQPAKWTAEHQDRYQHLLEQADIITHTGHEYSKSCMFTRNRYLVKNCDLLLAAYDGRSGGTEMTVNYARELNKMVTCLPPVTEKMKKLLMSA